ncbi:MAG: phenylalanine--tRNA ligase subunit alpha [Candidatus Buchananbacteria bacterium]|nr:phenylalanine--tRNA ligase subunit alpha [Candidatus Buchananbacteria bacterium]
MNEQLAKIQQEFEQDIAGVTNLDDLARLDIKYLGRKAGVLTDVLRGLKDLQEEERKIVGHLANQLKNKITEEISKTNQRLKTQGGRADSFDVTVPGYQFPEGSLHLVTKAIEEISETFERLGFIRRRYPEVEWDYYAFEALNMPTDHPARDEWETFFIDPKPVGPKGQRVLTPHTSSGQVREMEKGNLPIRMMNISKCYRRQIDVSHVPMFHQFEGLLIDKDVTIADLKGTLDYFVKNFFGPERQARIRPFHFQFTEPSFEIDVSCGLCLGKGCKMCKSGWLELGGAGMVHPNVLKAGKIDAKKYSGFAFGWGVERTYMMKSGLRIPDIRMMYQNDLRFLKQF